jgi:hypothetical protein
MIPEKCHSCVSSFIWYFHFFLAILFCLFLFLYQLKHFVHWRLVPKTLPPPTPTQSILFLNKFTLFHAVVVSNRKKKKKKLNPYRRCVCVCVFVVTLWHEENDSPTPPHSALMYREKCVWALLCVWVCKWAPWWKIPPPPPSSHNSSFLPTTTTTTTRTTTFTPRKKNSQSPPPCCYYYLGKTKKNNFDFDFKHNNNFCFNFLFVFFFSFWNHFL